MAGGGGICRRHPLISGRILPSSSSARTIFHHPALPLPLTPRFSEVNLSHSLIQPLQRFSPTFQRRASSRTSSCPRGKKAVGKGSVLSNVNFLFCHSSTTSARGTSWLLCVAVPQSMR